ncbi:A/G-specific adenine glycosylase [Limnoglobus roseus]|nr:A/G-specific adenine glycosylase [Limnoglobus roseus]
MRLPDGWPPRTLGTLRRQVLAWFDANQRSLPWRENRDPYRVWLSEVMLQQTTVAAVVPYFQRFLKTFPTLRDLAAADEQEVLKLWEGLGYYRRARHLHAAAKRIIADHGGKFPADATAVADLPGVGRYILGAVLSQAFEQKFPIVEANSLRVLARLFGYRNDPREGEGRVWVWEAATAVLPEKRIGDFNQAVMELGALVCTPTSPKCPSCPWAKSCIANRDSLQTLIPPPKKPPVIVACREIAVVIRHREKVLVCRRSPDAKRWANLWEFPHADWPAEELFEDAVGRIAEELTGVAVSPGRELLTIQHGVTRFAITMTAAEAQRQSGQFRSPFYSEGRWVSPGELKDYPTSTPQRKLFLEVSRPQQRLF